MSRLAIVIVAFNAREALAGALAALAAAPPAVDHEIVVVDNASTDGAADLVRRRFPHVRLIEPGRNLGFARANNLGIRATAGAWLLLLNPDTVVPPGAIDRLLARLEETSGAVAGGPRLVDGDGAAELSFGAAYSPLAELRPKLLAAAARHGIPVVGRYVDRATRREQFVDWVSGACLLVRREAAERAGLLDERYFMYAEDVDFCAALRAQGGRVLFTPVAEVVHLRGRSAPPDATRDVWRRSHLAYYRKHLPRWAPWLERYLRWRGFRG